MGRLMEIEEPNPGPFISPPIAQSRTYFELGCGRTLVAVQSRVAKLDSGMHVLSLLCVYPSLSSSALYWDQLLSANFRCGGHVCELKSHWEEYSLFSQDQPP